MVRQENIETSSTVTSIIPESTVNSDHNSTVVTTQNNQPEPISSELINLDISNTLQKAKNLANNQEPAITPQAAPKKVIDVIIAEANQLQKDKELTPPQEASVDIYKASQKAYNNALQHKEYQILADLWRNCMNYYLTVQKFLGNPILATPSMDGIHSCIEENDAFNRRMEEKQPSTTKASAKNSPSSQKQQFQCEKEATSSKQGKGQGTSHKTLQPRLPSPKDSAGCHGKFILDGQKKEEARLKY
ncbi:hypothetical protein O181_133709 [Austropuccinia psidii MF-1]|uniref:Uncharacterized protein n=1 Tax=Austropuccinia psidii MF-1 TaxID=1389203 RepID=A0A9Q3L8Y6_9BASI|nr:hypothetical protein [Austropuccinia psidii MF-1]